MKTLLTCSLLMACCISCFAQIRLSDQIINENSTDVSAVRFPPIYASTQKQTFSAIPRDATVSFKLPDKQDGVEPFFCALESKIRATSGILCKFRLGSVQYVDALEGKSYFHAVPNSQTTTKMMSVSRRD